MQKNKFIHEDIKAVCNSATKKLVALGLVASIGVGATVVGGGAYCHTVSAQSDTQDKPKLSKTLMLLLSAITLAEVNPQKPHELMELANELSSENKLLFEKIVNDFLQHYNSSGQIDAEAIRIFANVIHLISPEVGTGSNQFSSAVEFIVNVLQAEAIGNRERLAGRLSHFGYPSLASEAEAVFGRLENGYRVLAERVRDNPDIVDSDEFIMELLNLRREGRDFLHLEDSETQRECLSSQRDRLWDQYNAYSAELRRAQEEISRLNNIIQTRHRGAVDIDAGDITISECNEDLSRDVTVNQANSLTVAPGITTRIHHNDTEFRIGATAQETAENILRALTPNSLLNLLNRFTNQNTTNDEMKEERGDAHDTTGFSGDSFI